jgi:hypothetical protein
LRDFADPLGGLGDLLLQQKREDNSGKHHNLQESARLQEFHCRIPGKIFAGKVLSPVSSLFLFFFSSQIILQIFIQNQDAPSDFSRLQIAIADFVPYMAF